MSKNEKVKPGGDKVTGRLRYWGSILEYCAIKTGQIALGLASTAILVGFATDLRIKYCKRKMEGGK